MQTEPDQIWSGFQRGAPGEPRAEVEIKKPRVATIGMPSVCELAICKEGYGGTFDPIRDPHPKRSSRCSGRCEKHSSRGQLRECRRGECRPGSGLPRTCAPLRGQRGVLVHPEDGWLRGGRRGVLLGLR
eukprot:9467420-Pyramimonas_sp.AAC.1